MLVHRLIGIANNVTNQFGITVVPTSEYNMVVQALDEYNNMSPDDLRAFANDLEEDMA